MIYTNLSTSPMPIPIYGYMMQVYSLLNGEKPQWLQYYVTLFFDLTKVNQNEWQNR